MITDDPLSLIDELTPFYPNDPSLAIKVVREQLPIDIPQWIPEMIVFELFGAIHMSKVAKDYFSRVVMYDDKLSGKARDFLPEDLDDLNMN